jgi:hypothetical protein
MNERTFSDRLANEWESWKTHIKNYPNTLMWWNRYIKRRIKITFIQEGGERSKDRRNMENFYYAAINSILQEGLGTTTNITKLNRMKAKILRLQSNELQK